MFIWKLAEAIPIVLDPYHRNLKLKLVRMNVTVFISQQLILKFWRLML